MAGKGTTEPRYQMRTANWVPEDNLDLASYREVFRLIITTAPTPATVGLYGEWGSGKTSFMRQVRAELSGAAGGWDGDGCPTVWFDLWEHERNPAPVVAMLNVARHAALAELDRRLKATTADTGPLRRRWEELKTKLQTHRDALANAARALGRSVASTPGLTFSVGGLGVANPVADAVRYYQEIQDEQFRVIDDQTRLREALGSVVATLVEVARSGQDGAAEARPVVFFIDDLDRCPPGVMVDLLEQVRLFLSEPGCVFVIGMDDGVVVQSVITERPELVGVVGRGAREPDDEEKDAQERAARRYLEKMVQYPFMLPRLGQTTIEDFTKTVLAQVGFADAEADAVNAVVPGILHERRDQLSLRFVVRLANALVLNHLLTKDKIEDYDLKVTALLTVLQHAYNIEYKQALAAPDGAADLWRRLAAPPTRQWTPEPWMTWPNAQQLRTRAQELAQHVTPEKFAEYVELAGATAQVVAPPETKPESRVSGEVWFEIPGDDVGDVFVTTDEAIEQIETGKVSPGETIAFGPYPWVLLNVDHKRRRALLIAEQVLGRMRYHWVQEDTTWADCSLRGWLKGPEFKESLDGLWTKIATHDCTNDDNPDSGAPGGPSPTRDKVFLLSIDEYKKYEKIIPHTRDDDDEQRHAWWWLRSPGYTPSYAAYVRNDGSICDGGNPVAASSGGVRPVLQLDLERPF